MIKRILKWAGIFLGSLAVLVGILSVYIYFATEVILNKKFNAADTSDHFIFGKYLALTSCTECHGSDLKGDEFAGSPTPNLAVMGAAYDEEAFEKLMKEGIAIGGRENKMSEISLKRFSSFTDPEMKALHAYISTLHTLEEYQ